MAYYDRKIAEGKSSKEAIRSPTTLFPREKRRAAG